MLGEEGASVGGDSFKTINDALAPFPVILCAASASLVLLSIDSIQNFNSGGPRHVTDHCGVWTYLHGDSVRPATVFYVRHGLRYTIVYRGPCLVPTPTHTSINLSISCCRCWRLQCLHLSGGSRGGGMPPAGGLAIEVLVYLSSVMSLWTCHSSIVSGHRKWPHSGNYYINTVKTAFKWRTNRMKFII